MTSVLDTKHKVTLELFRRRWVGVVRLVMAQNMSQFRSRPTCCPEGANKALLQWQRSAVAGRNVARKEARPRLTRRDTAPAGPGHSSKRRPRPLSCSTKGVRARAHRYAHTRDTCAEPLAASLRSGQRHRFLGAGPGSSRESGEAKIEPEEFALMRDGSSVSSTGGSCQRAAVAASLGPRWRVCIALSHLVGACGVASGLQDAGDSAACVVCGL